MNCRLDENEDSKAWIVRNECISFQTLSVATYLLHSFIHLTSFAVASSGNL